MHNRGEVFRDLEGKSSVLFCSVQHTMKWMEENRTGRGKELSLELPVCSSLKLCSLTISLLEIESTVSRPIISPELVSIS